MDCTVVREAMSAQLDGEVTLIATDLMDQHLKSCVACTEWQSSALSLHRTVRVTEAEQIPDLTAAVLVAIGSERSNGRAETLRACRWLLAACALLQLATALPALIGSSGTPIHLDHELGSWDIGLAFGFLICALQPSRAWGMLPLLFVVAGALAVTSFVDIAGGHVSMTRESTHISELMGFFFTWMVARFNRITNIKQLPYSIA